MIFSGALDQIKEDVAACKRMGADELFFDPTFYSGAQTLEGWLAVREQVRKLV